jgi:NAD(P)H-hydrate epimerase
MDFFTDTALRVPAVTADQMREVDRIAVEDFGLQILQMMENAGRNLCEYVLELLGPEHGQVVVCAGVGGNGGGGLACARHLRNRGVPVAVLLDHEAVPFGTPAANQLHILSSAGLKPENPDKASQLLESAAVVVDSLIGYSLHGRPRGRTAELIRLCNLASAPVLSLDIPSGMDATTGTTPGLAVRPARIMTLALPKTGLDRFTGELQLADIGIPPQLYGKMGIDLDAVFTDGYRVELRTKQL